MPDVALPHGTLYYARSADRALRYPPVLLLHGAGGSHLDWPPQLRRLPGAVVYALDLAGHGRSDGPAHETLEAHAGDILAVLDALAFPRAILIGHSMGGGIAQLVALTAPDRIAGLVLIGTASKLPVAPALRELLPRDPAAALEWISSAAWGSGSKAVAQQRGRARLTQTPVAVLERDLHACQAFDTRAQLGQITAPALVIAAAADRMVPLAFAQTLAAGLPRATLVILPETGHMIPLERPAQTAAAIQGWLAEQVW